MIELIVVVAFVALILIGDLRSRKNRKKNDGEIHLNNHDIEGPFKPWRSGKYKFIEIKGEMKLHTEWSRFFFYDGLNNVERHDYWLMSTPEEVLDYDHGRT